VTIPSEDVIFLFYKAALENLTELSVTGVVHGQGDALSADAFAALRTEILEK
jgi:hypothetical protein